MRSQVIVLLAVVGFLILFPIQPVLFFVLGSIIALAVGIAAVVELLRQRQKRS